MSESPAEKRLVAAFSEALRIPEAEVQDDLAYATHKHWDSIAHMSLIAAIDSAFDIMLDTDDVIDMSSFAKAKEIVRKYGVEI